MYTYDWETDIAPYLSNLQPVPGGFTEARRGLLKLPSGEILFVKIAEDDDTKKWIHKEAEVYKILNRENYAYSPKLLAHSSDKTAIAVEYLQNHQFDHRWSETMLQEVMDARISLQKLKPHFEGNDAYNLHSVVSVKSYWPNLLDEDTRSRVNKLLHSIGSELIIGLKMVEQFAEEMNDWKPREDTLVHQDIRADNFGYDPAGKKGKLVDWNWLCIGDNLMDVTPMFVSMRKHSNLDPYVLYPDMYSRTSLLYIAGYWLWRISEINEKSQISPIRAHQATSAEVALAMLRPLNDV